MNASDFVQFFFFLSRRRSEQNHFSKEIFLAHWHSFLLENFIRFPSMWSNSMKISWKKLEWKREMLKWRITVNISAMCYMTIFVANLLNNLLLKFCCLKTRHPVYRQYFWLFKYDKCQIFSLKLMLPNILNDIEHNKLYCWNIQSNRKGVPDLL